MTIREFWHDIRDRFSDERHDSRDQWRSDEDWRERGFDRGHDARQWDDFNRGRSMASDRRGPDYSDDWSGFSQRSFRDSGGMTSASYDPGVWRGNTWSADERSVNWQQRDIDDYGRFAAGYTEMGSPDRYSATLYGVSYRGVGPQNWRRADARIREDVCEFMTEDDELDASEIEVRVQDGEVTLSGTVESRQDKRRAEQLAEIVSGVRDVHNQLQVQRARDTFLGTREALAGSSVGSNTRQ